MQRWVNDTEGLSIAHLRELIAAVFCLEQDYSDVIERLRQMPVSVKAEDELVKERLGFSNGVNRFEM